MTEQNFAESFEWGVATSAHQIEGDADGRGESVWDRFAAEGHTADGAHARIACDHHRLWRDDVKRMQWLGIGSYRFSVAWPRVMPEGTGPVNAAGLDFYDELVDGLLEAGITPCPTLYHWDLPQALQDRGGWGSRDVAEAFVDYARAVQARLGDRVGRWITHNEPWCIATLGHETGRHAPGLKDPALALRAAHHVLLSHGWAMQALREAAPQAELGIVLNLSPADPATDSPEDRDAARWFDGFFNRWYLDPLFRGQYPEDAVADRVARGHAEASLPFVQPGDLEAISTPMDFLGVNYYERKVMRAGPGGKPTRVVPVPKEELTDMGWEVRPQALHDLLIRLHEEYAPPRIYITENGAAYSDGPDANGRVADPRRTDFLHGHLDA
ncbi:MAG: beta-glucosidase, partial [Gemmatimonadetes bacterium]|nr:beta-glucosidase [Gemmatimonadota bacterium]